MTYHKIAAAPAAGKVTTTVLVVMSSDRVDLVAPRRSQEAEAAFEAYAHGTESGAGESRSPQEGRALLRR